MIVKINKNFNKLKLGIMGLRREYLAEVLVKKNIKFEEVVEVEEIDNTFDIVFGTGVYKLIKKSYLDLPTYGLIFFHETPLPEGKGNAPLQWTIFNNKPNLTITAFKAVKAMDAGDYIYQHNIELSAIDTLPILEKKRKIGIQECFETILDELKQGFLVFRKQSGGESYNPKRTPVDSELDPKMTLLDLWDKIRVCHNEKFPAFFMLNGKKIILKYEVID